MPVYAHCKIVPTWIRKSKKRFERIESILHATAVRGNEMEARFNRRMDRSEQRMDKFDRRLAAIAKLIQHGMKLLIRTQQSTIVTMKLFINLPNASGASFTSLDQARMSYVREHFL